MYEVLQGFTDEEIDAFVDFTERLSDNMGAVADRRSAAAAAGKRNGTASPRA